MTYFINYLIEANAALILFWICYYLFLKKETAFRAKRIFMLFAIASSVIFPFIHIDAEATLPLPLSIGNVFSTQWLPEIVITAAGNEASAESIPLITSGGIVTIIYCGGLVFFFLRFLLQLYSITAFIQKHTFRKIDRFLIAESNVNAPAFSFFYYIFIGQADKLNQKEKQQIILHESAHASLLHSFDILFINTIRIFFWFNPVLHFYKKTLVQLHEFEADARAVETCELNAYCTLLARVALHSAELRIANHFNNSLTLKRIEMMRKIKFKLKLWKTLSVSAIAVAILIVAACQDQVMSDMTDVAKSSTVALGDIPATVQQQFEDAQRTHPDKKFILLEVDDKGQITLDGMKTRLENIPADKIASVNVIKVPSQNGETSRSFIIAEYNEHVQKIGEKAAGEEDVFMMVEDTAIPKNGIDEFYKFVGMTMRYPAEAQEKKIEGKVFVEFIIEKDGTLSNFNVLKGEHAMLNAEAVRVLSMSPAWKPGMQGGTPVRQKMVMPIIFNLGE